MKKIILFGDSITAGYKDGEIDVILNERIAENIDIEASITNAGIPGDTTRDALKRVNAHVLRYTPDIVTVFFGANDVFEINQVSIETYKKNLSDLIDSIGSDKVLLFGPPYRVREESEEIGRLVQYNQGAREVALAKNCRFIDVLRKMQEIPNPTQYLQSDGLHFSEEGYVFLGKLMAKEINKQL